MSLNEPESKSVTIDEARQNLEQIVDEVASGKSLVTIEEDGTALVRFEAAVSPKRREIDALVNDPTFQRLSSIGLVFKDVPVDELEHEVTRALQEGRERRRKLRDEQTSSV